MSTKVNTKISLIKTQEIKRYKIQFMAEKLKKEKDNEKQEYYKD